MADALGTHGEMEGNPAGGHLEREMRSSKVTSQVGMERVGEAQGQTV